MIMISAAGNELCVGDLRITELVAKYGEPMYVYDLDLVEKQYETLRAALPAQVEICYSMKANPNVSMVAFLSSLTQAVEVSSLRELYVALRAGYTSTQIIFVGPSKSEEELKEAIEQQILFLVSESVQEIEVIDRLARKCGRVVDIGLRINPALDLLGDGLKMGGTSCQFGVDEEMVEALLRKIATLKNVQIIGIHVYMGTQILSHEAVWRNTRYVLDMGKRLRDKTGIELRLVDFGGGIGVPYFNGENDFDIQKFGEAFKSFFDAYYPGMNSTRYVMEGGRYLVAESGIYVCRVRNVKVSRGQQYVLVSGGLHHNHTTFSSNTLTPRHSLVEVLNKMNMPKSEEANICGVLCTPNDVLGKSVKVPTVEHGDLIGILKAGAYGPTASILDFLSHAHPVEVMVYKGKDYLIRKPSPPAEILRDQVLVPLASTSPFKAIITD
jgi:diaminopimelate decarboxylase